MVGKRLFMELPGNCDMDDINHALDRVAALGTAVQHIAELQCTDTGNVDFEALTCLGGLTRDLTEAVQYSLGKMRREVEVGRNGNPDQPHARIAAVK